MKQRPKKHLYELRRIDRGRKFACLLSALDLGDICHLSNPDMIFK
nr:MULTISPECIES: hypothetical protein [Rhizobium/Agrobacterium group]